MANYMKFRQLSPLMETGRVVVGSNNTLEVRTWNNTEHEGRYITKDAKFVDELWDHLCWVRQNGKVPEYFYADGIRTIMIGDNLNDAYHIAAAMVPMGVEAMTYLNEDYAGYYGREERLEAGVNIGHINIKKRPTAVYDEFVQMKQITDSVMLTLNDESNSRTTNLYTTSEDELIALAKTQFLNTFLFYDADSYQDYKNGKIDESGLISQVMKSNLIRKAVFQYGFDIMVLPPKKDTDFVHLLNNWKDRIDGDESSNNDVVIDTILIERIKSETGCSELTEEIIFEYLRFNKM